MKTPRKQWVRIGKVDVNPDNTLAMKIAQAGEVAEQKRLDDKLDAFISSAIKHDVIDAARNKRLRRAQKRLGEIQ